MLRLLGFVQWLYSSSTERAHFPSTRLQLSKMKKAAILFLVCIVIACHVIVGMLNPALKTASNSQVNLLEHSATSSTKTILIWNAYSRFELKVFGEGGSTFRRHKCAFSDCYITDNKSHSALEDFDAVIFNMPSLSIRKFPLNKRRRPEQRYIFFTQESAAYIAEDVQKFNHLFNWTMTYATNSDIPYTYGQVDRLPTSPMFTETNVEVNYASGKTKLVAWFISHCLTQSRREKYVSILRKHIDVDIYGGCYTLKCAMNHSSQTSQSHCYDMLERDYKFYLAFENSFCGGYVTEKFFDILQRRIIPVVMGAANYSALAPPHSFIDALQYSPQQLAAYLNLLASDDGLYNEYFWWKPYFKVESRYPIMESRALCHLCQKLHQDRNLSVYDNLRPLWSKDTQCRSPKFKGVYLFWGIL